MISRQHDKRRIAALLKQFPVVAILGARQVGKTTLAREIAAGWKGPTTFFDLEDPEHLAQLSDPGVALRRTKGLVVLDEIQRLPEVFTLLRVLADRPRKPARFLLLGSASPRLLKQASESLAGRIVYHELGGLSLGDVGEEKAERLWLRGGFPRAFLAPTDAVRETWVRSFITDLIERDIPQLGISLPAATLRRFWTMLAHYHGQTWNGSEIGRAFGASDMTVRRYLDTLTATLLVKQLQPWHENLGKRQVKAPKVYVADSGLLHSLLGVGSLRDLLGHPKRGASFEGFVIDQVIRLLDARGDECFFWGTHGGAELDLLIVRGQHRWGFEVKHTSTPQITPSMRSALDDLSLNSLTVVHAGERSFDLAPKIRAVPFTRLVSEIPARRSPR